MNKDQKEYLDHRQHKVNYPYVYEPASSSESRILKHEWLQILVVTITVFGLFMWMRTESRNDYRELRAFTEASLNGMRQEAKEFREMWAKETKDFHGRLIAIEERAKLGENK